MLIRQQITRFISAGCLQNHVACVITSASAKQRCSCMLFSLSLVALLAFITAWLASRMLAFSKVEQLGLSAPSRVREACTAPAQLAVDLWLAPVLGPQCVQAYRLCGPPACAVTAVGFLLEQVLLSPSRALPHNSYLSMLSAGHTVVCVLQCVTEICWAAVASWQYHFSSVCRVQVSALSMKAACSVSSQLLPNSELGMVTVVHPALS